MHLTLSSLEKAYCRGQEVDDLKACWPRTNSVNIISWHILFLTTYPIPTTSFCFSFGFWIYSILSEQVSQQKQDKLLPPRV